VEYFNLYGISFKVDGDIKKARERAYLANKLMFQTKMQNVNGLDIISNSLRLDDGTVVNVMSQHGLDTAEIYVPFEEVLEPQYRESTVISYWPAFSAYADESWDELKGVILCRGGGFNGPYEFVPKDALPYDYNYGSKEFLPEERIWEYDNRTFEDIIPSGIADVDITAPTQATATVQIDKLLYQINSNSCKQEQYPYPGDYFVYATNTGRYWEFQRTEQKRQPYSFTYLFEDDPNPGSWDKILYENVLRNAGEKPGREMVGNFYFYNNVDGSGTRSVLDQGNSSSVIYAYDYEGITEESWEQQHRDVAESAPDTYNPEYLDRDSFMMWSWNYGYEETEYSPWDVYGSVLDGNNYALVYSIMGGGIDHTSVADREGDEVKYKNHWLSIWPCYRGDTVLPILVETETDTRNEGPLIAVVDGVDFELFQAAEFDVSPRLQTGKVKYFKIGNKSIGMFYIVKNYRSPMDYMYFYAEVEGGDSSSVLTPKEQTDSWYWHTLDGMTDLDGDIIYTNGDNFRLIRETITIQEKLNPATGLWEEI